MYKLKYLYQDWNRAYYKLQSEEVTCRYYNNFYKSKMPKKLLEEKTQDVKTWAEYAYACNREFRQRMWNGEFSLWEQNSKFNDNVDKIARAFNVTAFIEGNDQPYAYLELSGMSIVLFFLDEHNRVYMQYAFQNDERVALQSTDIADQFKKDKLFIVEIEIFIFPEEKVNGRWKNKDYISYAFGADGYLEVTRIFDVHGEHLEESYVAESLVNVESNWEPYPQFGEWGQYF